MLGFPLHDLESMKGLAETILHRKDTYTGRKGLKSLDEEENGMQVQEGKTRSQW